MSTTKGLMYMFPVLLLLALLLPSLPPTSASAVAVQTPARVSLELNEVSEDAVSAIINALDTFEAGGTKEIWLRLNSFGGDVDAGQRLIIRLEQSTVPTTCVADFKAMSMAAFILESPGCR